jgi:hypothetical protein
VILVQAGSIPLAHFSAASLNIQLLDLFHGLEISWQKVWFSSRVLWHGTRLIAQDIEE